MDTQDLMIAPSPRHPYGVPYPTKRPATKRVLEITLSERGMRMLEHVDPESGSRSYIAVTEGGERITLGIVEFQAKADWRGLIRNIPGPKKTFTLEG